MFMSAQSQWNSVQISNSDLYIQTLSLVRATFSCTSNKEPAAEEVEGISYRHYFSFTTLTLHLTPLTNLKLLRAFVIVSTLKFY